MSALRVLLVEDDADAADAMAMALEISGAKVEVARSLSEARAALASAGADSFDAVVTDLGLPDGSGLDVARHAPASLPMIALSGFGGPEAEARSREAGFRTHLVKPATAEKVIAALRAALSAQP